MDLRSFLICAAAALALSGCKHQAEQGHFASIAAPRAPHAVRTAAAPTQLYLRGSVAAREPALAAAPVTMTSLTEDPYRLDSGDRLRVVVFGQENLSRTYAVDGGGFISMPLIGAVQARGFTTFALEREIAGKLRAKYVKDPKVTVEIQTYRPFFILGEVKNPGQFAYVNDLTVQTAVAIAGGYTERARESTVKVTRRMNGQEVTFKVGQDYNIRPGDTIYVTERFF